MKITDLVISSLSIPLRKPFKTAIRTATHIDDLLLTIHTDTDQVGYGEVPPTVVITGDSNESAASVILNQIKPRLIGMDILYLDEIMHRIASSAVHNTGAKAAVDMAVYDLYAKEIGVPLYTLLGGNANRIETDLTISVNDIDTMVADSVEALARGYSVLKVKVGSDFKLDIERISAIRSAVGNAVKIRVDANQGWTPKQAVRTICAMEDRGLDIELVEQPVKDYDVEGLTYVTHQVKTDILADEAVFSFKDAVSIVTKRAADLINIKLMKTGGIYNACKIALLCEEYGIECMIGCMLEGPIGIIAAAHFGAGKRIVTRADLDGLGLAASNPVIGGVVEEGGWLQLSQASGLGIERIEQA